MAQKPYAYCENCNKVLSPCGSEKCAQEARSEHNSGDTRFHTVVVKR